MPGPASQLLFLLPNWAAPVRLIDIILFIFLLVGVPILMRYAAGENSQGHFGFLDRGLVEDCWVRTLQHPGVILESPGDYDLWVQAWHASSENRWDEAEKLFGGLRAAYPVEPGLLACHSVSLIATARYSEAAETLAHLLTVPDLGGFTRVRVQVQFLELLLHIGQIRRLIETADKIMHSKPPFKAVLPLDSAATEAIIHRHPELLKAADAWSAFNCKTVPSSLTLKGTRGAVLYELGRKEEAELLLERVRTSSTAEVDRGITSYYLALLRFEQGKSETARKLLLHARLYYPQPWLIDRVRQAQLEHLDLSSTRSKNPLS